LKWGNTPHGKNMHVKEIYVIFLHLFDSGILLIIDLNKKKGGKGGGEFYLCILQLNKCYGGVFPHFNSQIYIEIGDISS
jgi:hypothetical protein